MLRAACGLAAGGPFRLDTSGCRAIIDSFEIGLDQGPKGDGEHRRPDPRNPAMPVHVTQYRNKYVI